MMTSEYLYNLLPAIYRIKDEAQGGPLKSLISVLAEQAAIMESDISGLYENWFIETCAEWVVPYIGELLGVKGLYDIDSSAGVSQRARVANTIAYRRRKGTATMLEQLARDTTGWNARVVEFFELLQWTQYSNHVRLHNHRTPDIRNSNQMELIDTAFDTVAHTVDVQNIANGRGKHNIPNIGMYLWRLQSYYIQQCKCRAVESEGAGRFTFHPLGVDIPLFNRPQTEPEITHLAEERNVPGHLRRRALWDDLEDARQALAEGRQPEFVYFGSGEDDDSSVFRIYNGDDDTEIPPEKILICNLSDWHVPDASKIYTVVHPNGSSSNVSMEIAVAVDPVLGRMTFPAGGEPESVFASYSYGFPGDVGSGPYNRQEWIEQIVRQSPGWTARVGTKLSPGADVFKTLQDAVAAWNAQAPGKTGLIVVEENETFVENLTGAHKIEIAEGSTLYIIAGALRDAVTGIPVVEQHRAQIIGDISVAGNAPDASKTPGELYIDGFIIEGKIQTLVGNLGTFRLSHSMLINGVTVNPSSDPGKRNANLKVELLRCLSGPLYIPDVIESVALTDCAVAGVSAGSTYGAAFAGSADGTEPGPAGTILRCTILGPVHLTQLELASEVIFTDAVVVVRRQNGCVRFSYLAPNSITPRRFRCQPDLALAKYAEEQGLDSVSSIPPVQSDNIRRRIVPSFTTLNPFAPAFAQLHRHCAPEITTGAEDGSEMGIWCFLKQPQRLANLRASLDEYLRFGLEAGPILVT